MNPRGRIAGAAAGILVSAAAACSTARSPLPSVPTAFQARPSPERPVACRAVEPAVGPALRPGAAAAILARAEPGTALCLEPGVHPGPLDVPAGVTVWGSRQAVVTSPGSGVTVRLAGAGARLLGVTVDGSGSRFDLLDAAVTVRADGVRVEGVLVRNALFGIIVEKANRVELIGNHVEGSAGGALGLRGDAVRLWETRDSRLAGNLIHGARDVVVWYSSGNVIEDNEVRDGRYGTHLMYSHDNVVRRNRYVGNVVGIFAMYSRRLTVENNLLAGSAGAAGIGLGLKESSGVAARDNLLVDDTVGAYIDSSPFEPGTINEFSRNAVRLCDVGVAFHSSVGGNRFLANSLIGNARQVRVDGGGDALGNEWSENEFDDYSGYDLDGDGFGDVPYELRSTTATLVARHPLLDVLRGTPALALLEAASRLLPLNPPRALLRDPRPFLGGRPPRGPGGD